VSPRASKLFVLLPVVMFAACASSGSEVSVEVNPADSPADDAVHMTVSGLAAEELASLELRSTDARGVRWSSSATFRADERGVLDLDRAAAVSGSYGGTSGMGLIWSMQPRTRSAAGAYWWGRPTTQPRTFTLRVNVRGKNVASTSFRRRLTEASIREKVLPLRSNGFSGIFTYPAGGKRRPAILRLGGSEGGVFRSLDDAQLAGRGYPVLALAYFGEPGLSPTLFDVPLEYFSRALTWLARRPEVDPTRIAAFGGSRGSEAALLLGVHYPTLVHAVVATVPSNVALCSFPGCTGPAWTLRGHPLPFTSEFDNPRPSDQPAAVIPVERIQGPILLVCGGADQIWNSCAFSRAISARLKARGHRFGHRLYAFPGAGHRVGSLVPYQPRVAEDPTTFDDEQRARAIVWPRLLHFLSTWRPE